MNSFKKTVAALVALLLLVPFVTLFTLAEDQTDGWCYIDGVNVTRAVNTAIIYKNIASTGQNQWGHNVVIDAEGIVTEIIEGGDQAGSNLKIPEGGMVVSAAGTKIKWFKDNLKIGSAVYYDDYTKRFFVCDSNRNFDPYFEKEINVSGVNGRYMITNPAVDGTPQFTYDIVVDKDGVVTARGSNVAVPEEGFSVSAATESDATFLIMYAPLGAKAVITDGKLRLSYKRDMLGSTLYLSIAAAKAAVESAKNEFRDIDYEAAEKIIEEAETADAGALDYKTAVSVAFTLETELNDLLFDRYISETRAAFHTPDETTDSQVATTVAKAKGAGLNTLILRISNGYGTIIPLPDEFRFKQDEKFGGFDVLASYIEKCNELDITLIVAIDVYYNEYASIAAPEWLSKPNKSQQGLSNKFFSPANEGFKNFYLEYIEYIVTHYAIENIMLDSLRYPKFSEDCDIGYDDGTITEFAEKYEIPIAEADRIKNQLFDSPHWNKWVEFRRSLISDMALSISETIREARGDITLTAVAARDSVEYYYMQDALAWLEDGIIDGVCVSLYERDSAENDVLPELSYYDGVVTEKAKTYAAYTGEKAYFTVGIESGYRLDSSLIKAAISEARILGADGFVFDDLETFINQNYDIALNKGITHYEAVSMNDNTDETIKTVLDYLKTKINGVLLEAEAFDEATAALGSSIINEALSVLANGEFDLETAKKLESDLAVTFASSPAKNAVLKEAKAVSKLLGLRKDDSGEFIPPEKDPETDESSGAGEDNSEQEESNVSTGSKADEEESLNSDISEQTSEKEKLEFGSFLVYCFVGIAFAAAIAGIVIAIRRKSIKPANMHMPRAAQTENEEKHD